MARNRKQNMSLTSLRKDRPASDTKSKANRTVSEKISTPLLLSPKNLSFDADCTHKRTQNLDIYSSSVRPKMDQQISVLSTDSGFLPKDIQDSSFVDDVIDELTSKGISHYDIISCHDSPQNYKTEKQLHMDKSVLTKEIPHGLCETAVSSKKKPRIELHDKSKKANTRRQKNNESSRKSRASRKETTQLKEIEVANLEAENRRLSILLSDFNAIAADCKQWIVTKMESADQ